MATLTIRDVPDDQKDALARIAKAHGRSMEGHMRDMIERETGRTESRDELLAELRDLSSEVSGWGSGEPWDRQKLYEDEGR